VSFAEWKRWLGGLPWSLRWFAILVLIRPTLDIFYFLKDVSSFLSPLYLVGVLMPPLVLASTLSGSLPRRKLSMLDVLFGLWSVLLAFGAMMTLGDGLSVDAVAEALKMVTPVAIYVICRYLIGSARDLRGLLMTFLYGSSVPFGMLILERALGPVGRLIYTRGYYRYEGLYADVLSYATYFMVSLLVVSYLFLDQASQEPFRRRAARLVVVGAVCVLGLLSIHHTATWGVAAALLILLMLHAFRGQLGLGAFVLLLGFAGYLLTGDEIKERLSTATATEMAVLEGEKDVDRAFHGRVARWKYYYDVWTRVDPVEKWFGTHLNPYDPVGGLMGGTHNDYLRIALVTGLVGLALYVGLYAMLLLKSVTMPVGERFVVRGAAAVMLLYSVTTVPTLYPALLYAVFAVFAYGALPRERVQRSLRPIAPPVRLPHGPRTPLRVSPRVATP